MPSQQDQHVWPKFLKTVGIVASFNQNLLILNPGEIDFKKKVKKIDIWWRGQTNGSLMGLFAYIMTLNPKWSGAKIRLLRVLNANENHEEASARMVGLIRQARIEAEVKIVPAAEDAYEVIKTVSALDADFVFLGMGATNGEEAQKSLEKILPLLNELPTTLLVWSNGDANIFV